MAPLLRQPLMAPLLPTDEGTLHAQLLDLRHAERASDAELLVLVEAACMALAKVDQDLGLSVAARPCTGQDRDAWQTLVAEKRSSKYELSGDETLTPTLLVPLLRRGARLSCVDAELGDRLLNAIGTLTASLAGHGEHTYQIGLGGGTPAPLVLHHIGALSPVSRLGIGACTSGWAGLRVAGNTVLELGCGTGAVGLACAVLGASEVWCTDVDKDSLALVRRSAASNSATTLRAATLLRATLCPDGMARRFGLVVANVIDGGDDALSAATMRAAALRAAARYVDRTNLDARVLCCFGQPRRRAGVGGRRREESTDDWMEADGEAAARLGEVALDCGLGLVASSPISASPAEGSHVEESALLFLFAPTTREHEMAADASPEGGIVHADRPHEFNVASEAAAPEGWVSAAAGSLVDNGACVLRSSEGQALIPAELIERCRCDARPRLDRLLRLAAEARRVEEASVDVARVDDASAIAPAAGGEAPLRFQELYSRAPWECRFDMTVLREPSVAASVQSEQVAADGEPMAADASKSLAAPWRALLAAIDPLVRPVLLSSGLFGGGDDDELCIEAVGCVLSLPGAPGQMWHPDCKSRVGLVNAFVPLVPLSEANGPTAVALGSHQPPRPTCPKVVRPLLAAAEVLLFDWRTWHRGCANVSTADRPVAYVTYARRGIQGNATYKCDLPSLETSHMRLLQR